MTSLKNKIKAYLRLIRIHTIIATGLTPSLGAFATYSVLKDKLIPDDIIQIFIPLFLVGIIIHIFGEILNDYMDYDIDKANIELSEKPLVSGDVSKRSALIGLILCFVFLIIVIIFSKFSILCLILFIIGATTGIIYQLISKKWLHSAVLLALYVFFIILFGAAYAGAYDNILSIPPLVYVLSILGFFQLWINTAILGHLKDIKNDSEYGAKTFPMLFGVKIEGDGKTPKLIIPMSFRTLVIFIQIINLFVAFLPIIYYKKFYDSGVNLFLLSFSLILISIIILVSMIKTMWFRLFERNKLMKVMAVREIATYFFAPVLLLPLIGGVIALIYIFFPLIWFFIVNKLISGDPMRAAI
jgi:4-hydroxybenzoate polyprenyltransferase